jgi:hypothetical protein
MEKEWRSADLNLVKSIRKRKRGLSPRSALLLILNEVEPEDAVA